MELDLAKNLTLSLISVHEFISDSSTNQYGDSFKNAVKIQLLISRVLTPTLKKWLENYAAVNNIKNLYQDILDFKCNDRGYNTVKKLIKDYLNKNNNQQYLNDFSLFDVTSCVSIARHLFKIDHDWLEKYSDINSEKYNEGDALNDARLIRNYMAHNAYFMIPKSDFDVMIQQLDKLLDKLNINNQLKKLKEEIKTNEIEKAKIIEHIQKWIQDKKSIPKEIRFKSEIIIKQIKPNENLTINTQNIQLTSLYIQQSLDEQNVNYLTFKIDYFLNSFDKIKSMLKSPYFKDYKTILIECFENKDLNQQLKDLLSKISKNSTTSNENEDQIERTSIIIIGIDELNDKFKQLHLEKFNFNSFDNQTIIYLLDKSIKFQDKLISIKDLIQLNDINNITEFETEIFNLFDSDFSEKLISNQNIELFKHVDDDFDAIKNYYISRTLKRSIRLKNDLLEDQTFLETNQIVFSENEFKKNNKNIHYLMKNSTNNHLEWIKSKGKISDLKKFLTNDLDLLNETEFLDRQDKIMIICEEPGMGKSTILSSFANQMKTNQDKQIWFIKFTLNKIKTELYEFKINKIEVFEFLKKILIKLSQLEYILLKKLMTSNRLIIMLDGFDEVLDYKNEIIELIKRLLNELNLNKIIITSREHSKIELEDHFQTFSFKMNKFEKKDQIEFLTKYWQNLNKPINSDQIERIIERFTKSLRKNIDEFIGIPLQTRMIAEIYQNDLANEIMIQFKNLADLYDTFVKKKIDIIIKEKYQGHCEIEREINDFYEYHCKYSFQLIFDTKSHQSTNKKIADYERKKLKIYGIIVDFDETKDNPKFLHQSYAEYFIAESICQNRLNDEYQKEIERIFTCKEYFLIRIFINDIQCHQKYNESTISIINTKEMIRLICIENLSFILRYFIDKGLKISELKYEIERNPLHLATFYGHKQIVEVLMKEFIEKGIHLNEKDKNGKSALHLACEYGHKEIAELLINKFIEMGIDLNEKDYHGRNALHLASSEGHKEIVKFLIEKFIEKKIDLNEKADHGRNALHLALFRGDKELIEILIEKGVSLNDKDENGRNALHNAAKEKCRKDIVKLIIDKFIENSISLNEKDKYDGKNALHLAVEKSQKDIIELLVEKFIEINIDLNEKAGDGRNALHLALFRGDKDIVEMLIQKGINLNDKDKNGRNALNYAAELEKDNNDIFELIINKSIEKGIDLNEKDLEGKNALKLATEKGHRKMVKSLVLKFIEEGIALNDKKALFHLAWEWGEIELAEILFERVIDSNEKDEYVRDILNKLTSKRHKHSFELLIKNLIEKNIDLNLKNNGGKNVLHLASKYCKKEIVELLIEKFVENGIDLNEKDKDGRNALHLASENGRKIIVELLINKFIEKEINFDEKDNDGQNALHLALSTRLPQNEMAELLIEKFAEKGINLNEKDNNGKTALHLATLKGRKRIVEMLINKRIDLNVKDNNGKTALHFASEKGRKEIVEMLIKNGVDVNIKDKDGKNALLLETKKRL